MLPCVLCYLQVDSEINEAMKNMYGSPESYLTYHLMHGDEGFGGTGTPLSTDIGDSHSGLLWQDVIEGDAISEFLNTVIIDPEDPFCKGTVNQGATFLGNEMWKNDSNARLSNEGGSCSGSDVEVAQVQVGNIFPATVNHSVESKNVRLSEGTWPLCYCLACHFS